MKILSVKKRNAFMSAFTVHRWKVRLETDTGEVKKLNCWAGVNVSPEVDSLLFDIDQKMGTQLMHDYHVGKHIEGVHHAELAINGKIKNTVHNGRLVLHVQEAQQQIAAKKQTGVGIRYGK